MSTENQIPGPVRVRFAPSPTGFLHVGGARTAIYNDLLRQGAGGAFILRIEDTDKERSDEAMTRQIQSALAWIGTEWDEGPFLQSERLPRHTERAEELLAAGKAYRCFCTAEELAAQRAEAEKRGAAFRYPRTCLKLAAEEAAACLAAGDPFTVRFRMPDQNIRFRDLVRGDMDFPPDALDDFILLRSDGSPTYHMSVVVDDIDMAITHVIRGEDHLSNTPKHIPLFRALGGAVPTFAHLPLILGPDKKRLSKRTGATSVEEFRAEGILPQALYNYLALLGWNPGDDREVMSRAGDDRGLLGRPPERLAGGVRPREALVDELPVPRQADARRRPAPPPAVPRAGRARRCRPGAPGDRPRAPPEPRPHPQGAGRVGRHLLHGPPGVRSDGRRQVPQGPPSYPACWRTSAPAGRPFPPGTRTPSKPSCAASASSMASRPEC